MSPMFRARGKLLGESAERKQNFSNLTYKNSITRQAIGG
jgi:hypothetical protein